MAFDPVLEFPLAPATTTRDRAIAMGRCGIAPRIAAANLGVAPPRVQAWYKAARAVGADILTFNPVRGPSRATFRLDDKLLAGLEAEATERGTTALDLARTLLSTICTEDLFDAVLDDD